MLNQSTERTHMRLGLPFAYLLRALSGAPPPPPPPPPLKVHCAGVEHVDWWGVLLQCAKKVVR